MFDFSLATSNHLILPASWIIAARWVKIAEKTRRDNDIDVKNKSTIKKKKRKKEKQQ
jgi:hypothetical protein